MYAFDEVKNYDPEIAKAIEQETQRQNCLLYTSDAADE